MSTLLLTNMLFTQIQCSPSQLLPPPTRPSAPIAIKEVYPPGHEKRAGDGGYDEWWGFPARASSKIV